MQIVARDTFTGECYQYKGERYGLWHLSDGKRNFVESPIGYEKLIDVDCRDEFGHPVMVKFDEKHI